MSAALAITIPPCQRVNLADLQELADFILRKIMVRYPTHNPRAVMGWLMAAIDSNEYFFVRCGPAVAMAQVIRDFLAPMEAREVFVFAPEDSIGHGRALYSDMAQWATNQGAARLVVEVFTDIEHADVSLELGTPKRTPVLFCPLPLE